MLASTHVEREDHGGNRFTDTISIKPIAYKRNGVLRRITNALGNTGDQNFPIGVDELCQFRLDARIAGKSPLAYFGKGQSRLTMALLNANNVSGIVSGNSVKFANAWDNADLTYSMAGHRLQKDILLKAGHPAEFTFRIDEHIGFDPETLVFGNDFRILQPILHPPANLLTGEVMDIPLTWQVSQQGGKWLLTVKLPAGDWTGWTLDPTLTLQPGPTDGQDTSLFQEIPDTLLGSADGIGFRTDINYNTRGLVKFDLSTIPSNAVILSGTLSVWNYWVVALASTGNVYAILAVNSAWTEAGANWNYAVVSTTRWAGDVGSNGGADAGCSVSGIDFRALSMGSWTWAASDPAGTQYNIALSVSQLQTMLATNYGMVGAGSAGGTPHMVRSSDHVTAANRPKLVIDYALPAGGAIFNAPFSAPMRGPFG